MCQVLCQPLQTQKNEKKVVPFIKEFLLYGLLGVPRIVLVALYIYSFLTITLWGKIYYSPGDRSKFREVI